jgi:Trk-type K+ transport system membrane component
VDNSGYQKKKGSTNNNIHLSTKIKMIAGGFAGGLAGGVALGITITIKCIIKNSCCNSKIIRNRSSTSDRN